MFSITSIGSLAVLPLEYGYDFLRACRWSKASPFAPRSKSDFYDIILLAHTIEKGLSQPSPRPCFGEKKILSLLDTIEKYDSGWDPFPIEKSYGALKYYVDWHQAKGLELPHWAARVLIFIEKCRKDNVIPRGGIKELDQRMADTSQASSPFDLLMGRYSCRRFKDETVDQKLIKQAVSIAQRAPSQCNRQATKLHCYQSPEDIHSLLTLQRGATGFSQDVRNLFVITSEMTAWSGCNARNQSFVDGSLFAMQLSLACSSLGLGSCALNLAVGNFRERKIRTAGRIPHLERLVMMMAFGYPAVEEKSLVVAMSERLPPTSVVSFH